MSDVNIPLLRKAVEWAEAEAAKPVQECRWDQYNWVTDPETRAMRLNIEFLEPGTYPNYKYVTRAVQPEECGTCFCIAGYVAQLVDEKYTDPHARQWDLVAADELGLVAKEADALFDASNSIEDVRRIAEKIAGEKL